MKKIIIFLLCASMIMNCGCNNSEVNEPQVSGTGLENAFEQEDTQKQAYSLGRYSFGFVDISDSTLQYEYTGEEVHIKYYVQGAEEDQNKESKLGLLWFTDGIPQPYSIEYENGTEEDEAYMHKFVLKGQEKKEFEVVFKPVAGKKGSSVGIIPATILQPDYQPDSEDNPNYGNYHNLSFNIPAELKIASDVKETKSADKSVKVEKLSDEILKEYKNTYGTEYTSDDTDPVFELKSDTGENASVIHAQNGKFTLRVQIYGGEEVTNRLTIFVNHEPVKINGKDYSEFKTEKGKVCCIDLTVDAGDLEELNTVYGVIMTAGDDYTVQTIYKTDSVLLLNK